MWPCRFCRVGQPQLLRRQPERREAHAHAWTAQLLNPVLGIGTFCTHTLVHASQAVPIPTQRCRPAQMSLIGCGVMTGVGAALYAADVQPGSSVAVFGCGGVGDSVIQGARLAGATTIIAVDIDPRKLEWAKRVRRDPHRQRRARATRSRRSRTLTGGNGVNYSFEAVGISQTWEQALWCRDLAGTCIMIGVPGPGPTLDARPAALLRPGRQRSACRWYGDCLPTRDFPLLAEWYRQGQLNLDEVVTRTITLDETEEAFEAMKRGETLRSVIVFE